MKIAVTGAAGHVGSNLTALSMGLQNLERQGEAENDAWKSKMAHIEALTRRTIHQLRDSVWALDAEEVTLQEFRLKLHRFLAEFVDAAGSEVEWEINCNAPAHQLSANFALELYRMLKEGIHNAIRHGNPREIQIDLQREAGGEMSFRLADDGQGFEVGQVPKSGHYGLRNMEKRTAELEGEFVIQAFPGEGTTLTWRFAAN